MPVCQHCTQEFGARTHAKFCSTRCRVAAHRAGQNPRPSEILAMLDSLEHFHFRWNPLGLNEAAIAAGAARSRNWPPV